MRGLLLPQGEMTETLEEQEGLLTPVAPHSTWPSAPFLIYFNFNLFCLFFKTGSFFVALAVLLLTSELRAKHRETCPHQA